MLAVEAAGHVLALPYCDFSATEKCAGSNKKKRKGKGNEVRKMAGTLNEKIKKPVWVCMTPCECVHDETDDMRSGQALVMSVV